MAFHEEQVRAFHVLHGFLGEAFVQGANEIGRVNGAQAGPHEVEELFMEGIAAETAHGEGGFAYVRHARTHGFHHFGLLAECLRKVGFNDYAAFAAFRDFIGPGLQSHGPAVVHRRNGQIEGKHIVRGVRGQGGGKSHDRSEQKGRESVHAFSSGVIRGCRAGTRR